MPSLAEYMERGQDSKQLSSSPGPAAGKMQLCKKASGVSAKRILYINTEQCARNLRLGGLLQQLTSCAWRASGSYGSVKSTDL